MISLSYVKKVDNGYIMNFYADTEDDVRFFDPTASFGIYGSPLSGSIVTLTSGQEAVNYYLNDSGQLVEVGEGEEPSSLNELQVGQTIAGFVINPNGKTNQEIINWLAFVDSSNALWSTGKQSELEFARIMIDDGHDDDGQSYKRIAIFTPIYDWVFFADKTIKWYGQTLSPGWYFVVSGTSAVPITELTEYRTSDASQNVELAYVDTEALSFINGSVIGGILA